MKVTWLAQAGLLFENERISVLVDPYFTNAIAARDPAKERRVAVPDSALAIVPDVLLITHDHADHFDPETVARLLSGEKKLTVLAPEGVYRKLAAFGGGHNYVLMNPHSVWTEKSVTFYAVRAAHSDPNAVGFILDDGDKTYYVSGDTIYNFDVIDDVLDLVDDGVDVAFLPINGVGCNMNAKDAADFAFEIGAKRAVPIHYGLFDSLDPAEFDFDGAEVLTAFEPTEM